MRRLTSAWIISSAFLLSAEGSNFQKFIDPLPIPPRVVIPPGSSAEITVTLNAFKAKLHSQLPETTQWGYNGSSPGPTIEVESGQTLKIHWANQLPTTHLFPAPKMMDMGGDPMPDVRSVTHLHGAVVTESDPMNRRQNNDGWPDAWITPGQEQLAEYPNPQDARTLWYHDHAMAETGRNVASGLVGMYLIHDAFERSLNLPKGDFEIPLIFQAKGLNTDGTLYYTKNIQNEFYGNVIAVNGKVWPYLSVEPRKYRFRMLNTSNARSLALRLVDFANKTAGPAFYQIGTDAGFLENTAILNDPADPHAPKLTLAPAERADVIIDFSKYAGRTFLLQNTSITDPDSELALPQLMVFKVASATTSPDTSSLPTQIRQIEHLDPAAAATTRDIVLAQSQMSDGSSMMMLNGKSWSDPITEKPVLGTTEIWNIVNTTIIMHPFHVHLVEFQVLDRRPFDIDVYQKTGQLQYTGPALPPDFNEGGWKDVVRSPAFMVTRIIMRFAPYPGYYVYHCHILEHEDMDMMRPFQVIAPEALPGTRL